MASIPPWYKVIYSSTDIQQGDFIPSCPIIIPPATLEEGATVEATVRKYNVIILSQSCDLQAGKLSIVLVCPYWPLKDIGEKHPYYRGSTAKEALRRGNIHGYHLLNKCDKKRFYSDDFLVVDFKNVMGVNFDFLKGFIGNMGQRLRLLSPYREHLSQSFARFFMRVGLPIDIPPFA